MLDFYREILWHHYFYFETRHFGGAEIQHTHKQKRMILLTTLILTIYMMSQEALSGHPNVSAGNGELSPLLSNRK